MKSVMTSITVVLLLSTLIWVAMYYEFPDAPLKPRETALVVFLISVVTAAITFAWKRRQDRKRKAIDEKGTHETHT